MGKTNRTNSRKDRVIIMPPRNARNAKYTKAEQKEKQEIFLQGIKSLHGRVESCKAAGISYDTFRKWYKASRTFQREVLDTEGYSSQKGQEIAIASIFKAMTKDWKSGAWWLERNFPDKYALRINNRQSGDSNNPVVINNKGVDLSKLTVEELRNLAKLDGRTEDDYST